MEIYLHICSKFNCIMSSCGIEFELKRALTTSFLLNTDQNVIGLEFFPLNKKDGLPFCVHITNQLQIAEQNSTAMLIDFGNNNFLLMVEPCILVHAPTFDVKRKIVNFGGQSHTLLYHQNSMFCAKIETSTQHTVISLPEEIEDISTKVSENNLFLFAKTLLGKHAFAHVKFENNTYCLVQAKIVDLLETDNNSITTYQNLLDSCNEGKVVTYTLSPSFQITSKLVFNDQKILCKKKELIPFAFFDAVKAQNFSLAREYLCSNLAQKLTANALKTFFGDFLFVFQNLQPNNLANQIALVYQVKDANPAKYFATTFNITFDDQEKIANIEEM